MPRGLSTCVSQCHCGSDYLLRLARLSIRFQYYLLLNNQALQSVTNLRVPLNLFVDTVVTDVPPFAFKIDLLSNLKFVMLSVPFSSGQRL